MATLFVLIQRKKLSKVQNNRCETGIIRPSDQNCAPEEVPSRDVILPLSLVSTNQECLSAKASPTEPPSYQKILFP